MSERSYVESKLRIYKSFTDHVETVDMTQQDQTETTTTISITQHKESGIAEITIVLDIVFGSHRMDKALSTYISDWSRTLIVDKIKTGIFNWTDNKWNQIQYFLKAIIYQFVYKREYAKILLQS